MGKRKKMRALVGQEAKDEATRRIEEGGGRRHPGERADPRMAALKANEGESFTTAEGIEEFMAAAREQGCTCREPRFSIEELGPGAAHVRMHHEENCPLMRSLQDGPS
jgi:hypothetical protein